MDYPLLDGVVQDCPALLLEPQRTNLVTYSEDFSEWNKGGSTTLTANYAISPDGSQNATRFQTPTGSGSYLTLEASMTSGNVYTLTLYLKNNGGENVNIGVSLGFSVGSPVVSKELDLTNEWVRYELIFTADSNSNYVFVDNLDNSTSVDCLIWGVQLEEGSYATSYIPTSGSAVTRNADVCNGAGTSAEFNDSEGVLFLETSMLSSNPNNSTFQIDDGTSTNRVRIRFTTTTNQINGLLYSGVAGQPNIDYTANDVTNPNKVAIRYQVGQIDLFFNGFEVGTITGNATPTGFDNLSLGTEGNVKQLMVFNEALTDSELEQITSWTSFGEMAKGQLYTIE